MKNVRYLFSLIILISIVVLLLIRFTLLNNSDSKTLDSFNLEIAKSCLQIIVVGVIGNLVSLFINKYFKDQERLQSAIAQKKAFITRLDKCYYELKNIRRILRIECLILDELPEVSSFHNWDLKFSFISFTSYRKEIASINLIQLDIETLIQEIELDSNIKFNIFENHQIISKNLAVLKVNIRELTKEAEAIIPFLSKSELVDKLELKGKYSHILQKLVEFLKEDTSFIQKFYMPYIETRKSLIK